MKSSCLRIRGSLAHAALACLIALSSLACGDDMPVLGIAEEYPPTDEAATTARLIELTKKALEERHAEGTTQRFNQVRHPGCVRAEFAVEGGLDRDLAVGLFAQPRSYPTWIRFATAASESDDEKDFRGMSLKLMGVEGEMLFGEAPNFDIVLNSHPVLFVGTPKLFAEFIESRHPLLFFLNPFDAHIKEFRIALAGRQHHASHLEIPYWSTTPYLLGVDKAVKYRAHPCGEVADHHDDPEHGYLHQAMREHLAEAGACFDFEVQLQTDPAAMPVEDASVEWDAAASPFRKVATIQIPAQTFDSPAQMEFCENLAFNPWRALPEHRPIGGLNRVRKELYAELARFRHQRNGVAYREPTGDEVF